MNAVYSLKFSQAAEGLIPVPEYSRKCKSTTRRKLTVLSGLLMLIIAMPDNAGASIVSAEIDYQIYRDFAENKGMFKPGAASIAIHNKKGELVGNLDKAPMPDISSVNVRTNPGVATLIDPQYVVSVRHNLDPVFKTLKFGDGENEYTSVNRNDHPYGTDSRDFNLPRLNKLVTEVVPTGVTTASYTEVADSTRFPLFYRMGSGTQYTQITGDISKDSYNSITGAYQYLTGGLLPASDLVAKPSVGLSGQGTVYGLIENIIKNVNAFDEIMVSRPTPGDSGSPVFGWDAVNHQWVLVAVHSGGSSRTDINGTSSAGRSYATVIPIDFVTQIIRGNYDAPVMYNSLAGEALSWTFDNSTGTGVLTQGSDTYTMHGQKGTDLNAGKNLVFQGQDGKLVLKNNVSQGAGSLTFRNDYMVTTANDNTWTGAGIIVDKDASVYWQVNGVKGDNLHKIGGGTLLVQGTGINEGGLKVGDGTVVLGQLSDSKGNVQAFSSVNIASGRPTVVLSDDRQVDPDTISWGYRGGTLDVNGNSLTFRQLKAADYGAVLTNNASKRATITLNYSGLASNTTGYLFHGQLNGNLNVENRLPEGTSGALVLDGSAAISGTFTQENGRLTLQGHPVIHAYNSQSVANKLASLGDHSVLTQPTSFDQKDWENRTFAFDKLLLKNTDFGLGRNATLNTTIEATDSVITLGDSRAFIDRKDGDGTAFVLEEGTSVAVNDADRSVFNGSAVLTGNTTLNIQNATYRGDITGHNGSRVELSRRSNWNMTKSSTLDSFWSRGGSLSLVTENWSPKNLTVNTMNAGSMHISMGVSETGNTGDRIDIRNQASGGHNTIDLSSLFDKTISLTYDLTLASAPAGVSHSYFGFATLNRGFTRYSPDTQVTEENGKVLWQLKAPAQAGNLVERPGQEGGNGTPENTQPETEKPGGNNTGSEGNAGNNSGTAPAPSAPVAGDSLFQGADNTQLIREARDIFATREYILSDNIGRWQQVVDNTGEVSGAWAMTGYSHGGYQSFSVNQQGLDFGLRKVDGDAFWGAGVQLADGRSKSDLFRDDYSLWGISLFYGKSFTSGLFIDGALGYSRLTEDLASRSELSSLSGKVTSNLGTLGVRAGYRREIEGIGMSVTPTVSLDTAWMDGYSLRGKDMSAELHAGNAVWGKMGILVEKTLGEARVSAGIYRTQQLKDMPGLTLEDAWKSRQYEAVNDSRYSASLGVEGKVSDNLRVQMTLNTSFDGYFKTDAEGRLGVRYMF